LPMSKRLFLVSESFDHYHYQSWFIINVRLHDLIDWAFHLHRHYSLSIHYHFLSISSFPIMKFDSIWKFPSHFWSICFCLGPSKFNGQRLIYAGKQYADDKTLRYYSITVLVRSGCLEWMNWSLDESFWKR
jgi:hypothetical protein